MRRADQSSGEIPRRPLGRTGVEVSAIALGGYHLGLVKTKREVIRIVQEAFEQGITFMDNGWEYRDDRLELYKTSKAFDGLPGRKQHGFPPLEDLAA